ncbi:hypothetical protein HDU93_007237 [Gonapodya sp. JEL0774]|nr:hypothetical protein HDU93_007237 [Gonapodya sp. JEL0774]
MRFRSALVSALLLAASTVVSAQTTLSTPSNAGSLYLVTVSWNATAADAQCKALVAGDSKWKYDGHIDIIYVGGPTAAQQSIVDPAVDVSDGQTLYNVTGDMWDISGLTACCIVPSSQYEIVGAKFRCIPEGDPEIALNVTITPGNAVGGQDQGASSPPTLSTPPTLSSSIVLLPTPSSADVLPATSSSAGLPIPTPFPTIPPEGPTSSTLPPAGFSPAPSLPSDFLPSELPSSRPTVLPTPPPTAPPTPPPNAPPTTPHDVVCPPGIALTFSGYYDNGEKKWGYAGDGTGGVWWKYCQSCQGGAVPRWMDETLVWALGTC